MAERAHINSAARVAATAVLLALALAACQTAGGPSYGGYGGSPAATPQTPQYGTNAPAQGFENLTAGSEEDFILNVGRRVYFTAGSAELDDTSKVTLDQQADWLNRYPGWLVKVQGFADDPGNAENNRRVSQARADAVMGYLASRGVAANRMWSKGYGRDRLVRDCPEDKCRSQNRRVISNLRDEFDDPSTPSSSG